MFYRLITNLQYSPGLIGQLTFYAKRLQREEFVRRVGLIFSLMALTMHAFLIFSPPQPSLASSANDIVYGGGSKAKIASSVRNSRDDLGRTDIKAIFDRYGISAEAVEGSREVTIYSRAENNYYSIGRQSRFSSAIETRIDIPGRAPVYSRPLHAWDSGAYSKYQAFYGKNNKGKEFWILKNCGNIVLKTPTPDALPPSFDIKKSIKEPATKTVKRGQHIVYSIRYRNAGPGPAPLTAITDLVPKHTKLLRTTGPVQSTSNGQVHWSHVDAKNNPYGVLGATTWYHEVLMRVQVSNTAPDGTRICNVAKIGAFNGPSKSTPAVCVTVDVPPAKVPAATCTALTATKVSRDTYSFKGTGSVKDGASISKFNFDFGDDSKQTLDNVGTNTASTTHTYAKPGSYNVGLSLDTSIGKKTAGACNVQIVVDEPEGEPEVVHAKLVKNLTQNLDDANGTLAQAGDRLEYHLITENLGTVAAVNFTLPVEDIADVLEYADIEELNDAVFDKEAQTLSWPSVTIEAGAKIEKVFIVKVKDPIPQTPVSASDPGSFDLTMSNSYGNDDVEIKLPPANNKRIETVARSLPKTGVGDSLVTSTFLIGMSTYFYSRNRLISKELKLVKKEFTNG